MNKQTRLVRRLTPIVAKRPRLKTKKVYTAKSPVYRQLQEIVRVRCTINNYDPDSPLFA